jgi:two-component system response regulator HydG
MPAVRILIHYPHPAGLALLTSMLKSPGHVIEQASSNQLAARLTMRNDIDMVLAGVEPNNGDMRELLALIRRKNPQLPVVLLFPRLEPARAKEALRLGAMAVLSYPVPAAELRAAVLQALEQPELRQGEPASVAAVSSAPLVPGPHAVARPIQPAPITPALTPNPGTESGGPSVPATSSEHLGASSSGAMTPHLAEINSSLPFDKISRDFGLIGNDPSWRQVLELASALAPTSASVLLIGERGTGKSRVARLLHALGRRAHLPFVAIEASTLHDRLATEENEPLGSSPSSSASPMEAWGQKLGEARGGTFYIREIAGLSMELQPGLYRELQVRDFKAKTECSPSPEEVRFVMSTSEDLPLLIDQGRLQHELFHRVSIVSLMLLPLRHRRTDALLLAESFRARYAHELQKPVAGFTRCALDLLQRHDWPGNIRELEAAIGRAVAMCTGRRITSRDLTSIINHRRSALYGTSTPHTCLPTRIRPLKEALAEPEKKIIIEALQAVNWNLKQTARVLDINRATLYKKMKKYGFLSGKSVCPARSTDWNPGFSPAPQTASSRD